MADEKDFLEEEGIDFGSDKKTTQSSEYELIDEGTYEVKLEKLEPKTSNKNGKVTKFMVVTFSIRDDVEQKFKKRKIWYTIFAQDGDIAFNFNEINSIIITQEGRDDYKTHFKSADEVFQYLIGLHLKLDIGVEFNQFKGKDDNIIVKGSFAPSDWDKTHKSVVADSDDLPF